MKLDSASPSTVAPRTGRGLLPYRMPVHGWAGAVLNLASWYSSWSRTGPSNYTFFPLWFGFILFLDGLVIARSGTSPLHRSWRRFIVMFLCSSVFWWVFEGLNVPVQNWHYVLDQYYSPLAYFLLASLNFSTVLPAVLEIAELISSIPGLTPRLPPGDPGPRLSRRALITLLGVGIASVALPFAYPHYAYGLLWLCLIFLLDPINNVARRKSAFGHLLAGDWRFLVVLPIAGVICGFFWEMWNSRALPRWYYTVPYFDAAPHLFAMPLPGYLGYLPFAVELFAMYQFILLVTGNHADDLVI